MTTAHRELVFDHALKERPNEACGLFGGLGNRAEVFYPVRNKEASPIRYEVDPADLLRVFRDLERRGLELVGIVHSHVFSRAYPSQTDIRLAYYPDAFYLLISLMSETPSLKAFRIVDGTVDEAEIVYEGAAV
ncbi:MAG: M67 family metallopeptidase [Chloroflexi bacterium]|nr:M67 family metallopeptidase [Chloroflexota bacterium]